ncbi:MAG TPA: putative DNA-binding domain-containing protein, partial [Methylophilus sp.]|nr:putative DNA-binding domain-containing protein [Methylophilus sp.]
MLFQEYQAQFTAHIRNPQANRKPARVADSRMAVYREIVFNNIFASVSACFPVCRQIFGARAWRKLVRGFFAGHGSETPFFREIPAQFLKYLSTQTIPEHLKQLAHYEWAELHVSTMHVETPPLSAQANLLSEHPILNPAHLLLAYDYPVHMLSKRHKTA